MMDSSSQSPISHTVPSSSPALPFSAFTAWQARGAAVASGLLLAAAFPPVNAWPLVFAAPVPLLLAVWGTRRRKHSSSAPLESPAGKNGDALAADPGHQVRTGFWARSWRRLAGCFKPIFWTGFRLGWITGLVFFTATLWWVQYVTFPGMLALCAYLALYPGMVFGVTAWLGMRPDERWPAALGKTVTIAGIWCGLEWVRSVALSGFPWNGLAVPLFPLHGLRHLSASVGITGLSAVALLPPLLATACLRLRRGRQRHTLLAVLGLMLATGGVLEWTAAAQDAHSAAAASASGVRFRALLIQPNVSMAEKLSPDWEVQDQRYFDLVHQTDAALASTAGPDGKARVDLVVWPESAIPGFFQNAVEAGAFAPQLAQGDFTLVTGADSQEWGELHNSVAALRRTVGNHQLHDKVCLVPFGEFIPFRKQIPLLERMLGGLIPYDFTPGRSLEPLKPEGQPFDVVPLVCFEDTIGRHARRFIRPQAQVLVNVTNDNWFAESPAADIHFVNARWRAPELRRTLVRSSNTGVTARVSAEGVVERIPNFQEGMLSTDFSAGDGRITFYARHGDIIPQAAGLLSLLACGGVWISRRRAARPI